MPLDRDAAFIRLLLPGCEVRGGSNEGGAHHSSDYRYRPCIHHHRTDTERRHNKRRNNYESVEKVILCCESILAFHTSPLALRLHKQKARRRSSDPGFLAGSLFSYMLESPPGSILGTTKPESASPMPDAITLCATKMRRHITVSASSARRGGCGLRLLNISRPFHTGTIASACKSYRAC